MQVDPHPTFPYHGPSSPPPLPTVPGQPMNFRAEAKSETSIGLSWSPPRQESIIKYELLYREGDHGREVRWWGGRRWLSPLVPAQGGRLCAKMPLSPSLCPCSLLICPPLTPSALSISMCLRLSISVSLPSPPPGREDLRPGHSLRGG